MNTNDYWTSRRTIRRYTDRHVSDELLDTMLGQAAHAPTTGNMQLYSVIVSRSDDEKKALAPAHFNQPQVTGCDVVLTFCADLNRFTRWCEERDADPCYDNVQSLVAAVLDTALLAQQFNTIAEMNGLGCCMLGTTTYNADMIGRGAGRLWPTAGRVVHTPWRVPRLHACRHRPPVCRERGARRQPPVCGRER